MGVCETELKNKTIQSNILNTMFIQHIHKNTFQSGLIVYMLTPAAVMWY